MAAALNLSQKVTSTFCDTQQAAACIMRPLQADTCHTCGLSSIFSHAHVAGENRFYLFCGLETHTLF